MKKRLSAALSTVFGMCFAIAATAGITVAAEGGTAVNMDGNWAETGGAWTKNLETDGSVTLEQTKNEASSRYALMTGLKLDGLSVDITYYTAGGIYFGMNQWGCYATGGGLGLSVNTNWNRYNLIIGPTDQELERKFYDTPEDALAQTNAGTKVDGSPSGCVIITSQQSATLNISFERYSTYRYEMTVTSDSLYPGMANKSGNSVTYYINVKDFPELVDNSGNAYLIAQGNAAGNAKMNVSMVQGDPVSDFIEDDGTKTDEIFEQFVTDPQTASEGKRIVSYRQEDLYNTGNAVGSLNANGTVTVSNPGGAQWGDRTGLNGALMLDGLKLTSYYSDFSRGGNFGSVILAKEANGYYGENQLCMVYYMAESSQARIYVGSNHDVYGSSFINYLYKSEEGAASGNAEDKLSCLIINGAPAKYSVEFTRMSEKVYKLTFTLLNDVVWHDANGFADAKVAEAYINTDEIANLFNADGYVMPSVATDISYAESKVVLMVEESEKHIREAEIELETDSVHYAGEAVEPAVTRVQSGTVVFTAEDYDVSYLNNDKVGQGTVVVTFKNGYSGVISKTFEILGRLANDAAVTLEYESIMYTTMPNTPAVVSVVLGDQVIDKSFYDVTYENNTEVGTATVRIVFKGNYAGEVTTTFEITKIRTEEEGENISLTFEEATLEKMQTLGDQYTYTVKDSEGNVLQPDTPVAAGTYTVTAVKESDIRIEIITYSVQVAEKLPEPDDSSSDSSSSGGSEDSSSEDSTSDSSQDSSSDKTSSDATDAKVEGGCGSVTTAFTGMMLCCAVAIGLISKRKSK